MQEKDDLTETETAVQEVLREVEEAERRASDAPESRGHDGEAGEAVTPDTQAQEESRDD